MKTWSKVEIELLADNADKPKRELEKLFPDRSWISVKRRKERLKMGISCSKVEKRIWSGEEEELLAKNIHKPKSELEKLFLSRSWYSIKSKKNSIKGEKKIETRLRKEETEKQRIATEIYERFMDYHRTYWSSS